MLAPWQQHEDSNKRSPPNHLIYKLSLFPVGLLRHSLFSFIRSFTRLISFSPKSSKIYPVEVKASTLVTPPWTHNLRKTVESARLPFLPVHSQISSDSIRPNFGPANGRFSPTRSPLRHSLSARLTTTPIEQPSQTFCSRPGRRRPRSSHPVQRQPMCSSCL